MINQIAINFTNFLIRNGAEPEDQEIYTYSVESFLSSMLTYGTILLVAAFFNVFIATIMFMAFFLPLRSCIGGYHADTHAKCFIMSVVITIGLVLLLPYANSWILIPAPIIALIVVLTIAPVVHENNPLSDGYIIKVKKVAKIIILAEIILLAVIYGTLGYSYYNMAALGILTASVSAISAYARQKLN